MVSKTLLTTAALIIIIAMQFSVKCQPVDVLAMFSVALGGAALYRVARKEEENSEENCEDCIKRCDRNVCGNGLCLERSNGNVCVCDAGYIFKDDTCERDPCLDSPCGDGTCISQSTVTSGFICICPDGQISDGTTCVIDPCRDSPCGDGSCTFQSTVNAGYICTCPDGQISDGTTCVGCPDGTSTFTDGDRLICYFTVLSSPTSNFAQSRDLCGQEITGADLAIIPNMAAQQFVVDLLNGLPVWISVNDLDADDVYTDATGEAIMFDNFGLTPPAGLVLCVTINSSAPGEWAAGDCNLPFPSLCSLVIGG